MSNNNNSQSHNDETRDLTMVERWEIQDQIENEAAALEAAAKTAQSNDKSDNKPDDETK